MARRTTSTTRKVSTPKPGPVYISANEDEWRALQKLGLRERWLYLEMKWKANFRNGILGNFGKQKLTYQSIADLIVVPGVPGQGDARQTHWRR
jgi:hypothetical protein